MEIPILTEIKTDMIQGHVPAAIDKVVNVGKALGGQNWIGMALITTIEKYLKELMTSEEAYPSTIKVEVALATLDAHLVGIKFTMPKPYPEESRATPVIYLNEESSRNLNLPYLFHCFESHKLKETVFVKLKASKIYKSTFPNAWDAGQKSILFPLIERKQSVMLESTKDAGWWKIISVVGG